VKEAVFPGKWSFHHQVKKLGKTFIFLQLCDFLVTFYLKHDVYSKCRYLREVPVTNYKQKILREFFFGILNVTKEKIRIRIHHQNIIDLKHWKEANAKDAEGRH
jgi:hypothetical protein